MQAHTKINKNIFVIYHTWDLVLLKRIEFRFIILRLAMNLIYTGMTI